MSSFLSSHFFTTAGSDVSRSLLWVTDCTRGYDLSLFTLRFTHTHTTDTKYLCRIAKKKKTSFSLLTFAHSSRSAMAVVRVTYSPNAFPMTDCIDGHIYIYHRPCSYLGRSLSLPLSLVKYPPTLSHPNKAIYNVGGIQKPQRDAQHNAAQQAKYVSPSLFD